MSTVEKTYLYRLDFQREEPAIWLGHLDMMRTFERSLRRAQIPLSWSGGFNPRPQIVFALPISVGMATQGDLVDISCTSQMEEAAICGQLNQFLPKGITVSNCRATAAVKKSLMGQVVAARYLLTSRNICQAARQVLPSTAPLVTARTHKGKTIDVDLRPLIHKWHCLDDNQIEITVSAGSSSNLRPDLLLQLLVEQASLDPLAAADARITRLELILK